MAERQDSSLHGEPATEPFGLLARWLDEARRAGYSNPDAISLATVAQDGAPRARMVLCRGMDATAGTLTFYTNRESTKGRDLAHRAQACAVFHWDAQARQAIVSGPVAIAPEADSDAYWATRPRLSQLAAWASQQSRTIGSRAELLSRLAAVVTRFGDADTGAAVPRPPHWGGYRITAHRVELWVGNPGRMHDRVVWTRAAPGSQWSRGRLQP